MLAPSAVPVGCVGGNHWGCGPGEWDRICNALVQGVRLGNIELDQLLPVNVAGGGLEGVGPAFPWECVTAPGAGHW